MRSPFFGLVLTFGALAGIACGGTAESKDPSSSSTSVKPGNECPTLDKSEPAADGCNTCTCTENGWACTEKACATSCSDGQTKTADDGCNTCSCYDGGWACTQKACIEPSCPAPRDLDGLCAAVMAYARSPETGACCEYGSPCAAPESWEIFYTEAECSQSCTEGETVPAPDGCNTCTCLADGSLACTKKACGGEPKGCGGWLGDTCAEDEYCAYEEGQLCGAADASATCQKRPGGCDFQYEPVCGCDGNDYGNACAAASAGTGVSFAGTCDSGGPK